jgi:uncharacterized protein YeeX (DUF496 family)
MITKVTVVMTKMTGDYEDHLVITKITVVITKMTGDYESHSGDDEDDWWLRR